MEAEVDTNSPIMESEENGQRNKEEFLADQIVVEDQTGMSCKTPLKNYIST